MASLTSWKEQLCQQLKSERMLVFIDPDPTHNPEDITDEHEQELYERKNNFFWLILLHTIQCATGKAILNKYRKSDLTDPDAREAFLDIDKRMTTGLIRL